LKELQDAWGSLGGGYTEEKFETYIALTANIDKVLVLAETTLKAFEDGIPKSQMTKYMEYNSAAMKVGKYEKRLSSIVSTVKRLIPKTRENMGKVEETLKTRIDEDLEWIHQKDTQPSGAAVILGRVKQNLARLKELSGGKDAKYAKKALAKAKKGYKKAMKRVAKTRMPKDGSSDDALKETMSTLYAAKYKKDKVERVVIPNAKWREFAVIEITESGRLFRARYRAMNVHVAVTKGKKKPSKVYIIGFQKKYSRADGKWGALGLQSIGESYPILKKNIKK
ncbi:hypothetical protein KAI87_13640, partial [Myxococcota bacterium]|nr:hypothetical protein [Myxococcota bacterium]